MKNLISKKSIIWQIFISALFIFFSSLPCQAAGWQEMELPKPSNDILQGHNLLQCELKNFPSAQRLFYACLIDHSTPATKQKNVNDYWVVELDNQGKKKQEWMIKNISNAVDFFSASLIAADQNNFYLAVTEIDSTSYDPKIQTLRNWVIKNLKIYRLTKTNKQEAIDYGQVLGGFETLPAIMVQPSSTPGKRPACLWIAINRPSENSKNLQGSSFEVVEQCYDRKDKDRLRSIAEWKTDAKSGWYELSFLDSNGSNIQIGAEKLEIGAKKAVYQTGIKLWFFAERAAVVTSWEKITYALAVEKSYTYAKLILPQDFYGLDSFFYRHIRSGNEMQTHLVIPNVTSKSTELLIRQQPKGATQPSAKGEWPIVGKMDLTKLMADRWYQDVPFSAHHFNSFLMKRLDNGWVFFVFISETNGNAHLSKNGAGEIYTFLLNPDGSLRKALPIQVLNKSDVGVTPSNAKIASGLNDQTFFLLLQQNDPKNVFSLWRLQLDQ